MSANDQTLIQQHHDGLYYIFSNVNAESWDEVNTLKITDAVGCGYRTKWGAYKFAEQIEDEDPTEYGIRNGELAKDGAKIVLIP